MYNLMPLTPLQVAAANRSVITSVTLLSWAGVNPIWKLATVHKVVKVLRILVFSLQGGDYSVHKLEKVKPWILIGPNTV